MAAILVSSPGSPAPAVSTSTAASTSTAVAPANVISSTTSAVQAAIGSAAAVANGDSIFTCAADSGQIRTDGAGVNYRISCSSDTLGVSYATHSVPNGFNDCFDYCDRSMAIDGQVCTAFTFQADNHAVDGVGSGICTMRNRANQDFTSANNQHVAAIVTAQAATSPPSQRPANNDNSGETPQEPTSTSSDIQGTLLSLFSSSSSILNIIFVRIHQQVLVLNTLLGSTSSPGTIAMVVNFPTSRHCIQGSTWQQLEASHLA